MPMAVFGEIIPNTIYAVTPKALNSYNLKIGDRINLYVLKTGKLSKELNLNYGDEIELLILGYSKPKRGKLNGYYKVEYISSNIQKGKMRVSTPMDMKEIAETAGITVAGLILQIPGFSQAIAVSKGLIAPNENQTRIESAGKNLYESTPLTYIEKGNEFTVEKDGIVVIRLRTAE